MPIRNGFLGELSPIARDPAANGQPIARALHKIQERVLAAEARLNQVSNDALFRISATASISVRKDSAATDVGTEPRLNFVAGSGITQNVTDVLADREVKITTAVNAGFGLEFAGAALVVDDDAAHQWTAEQRFDGGIDLGTSGRVDSNVANTGTNIGFLFKPTTAFSGTTTIAQFQDSAGNVGLAYKADGTWEFGGTSAVGGYINLGAALSQSQGINFAPASMSGAGATTPLANTLLGAQFGCTPTTTPAGAYYVGGYFYGRPAANMTAGLSGFWGGWFHAQYGNTGNGSRTFAESGGWKVFGARSGSKNIGLTTNWYGGYVENSNNQAFNGAGSVLTNGYGLYLEEQTRAATINNGILLKCDTSAYKALAIRDQNSWISSDAASELSLHAATNIKQYIGANAEVTLAAASMVLRDGMVITSSATTTGIKIGAAADKLGFFNQTPAGLPAAYTQTYATASRTHSNLTAATLTDSTGGTANTTLVAISGTGDDANVNNNFADLAAQVNALLTDITNVKQVLNSVIDDDQILGLKQ